MYTARLIKRGVTAYPLPQLRQSHEVMKSCYLCGGILVIPTKEHIIAKSIFCPNSLDNPLILKACYKHNQEKRRDDEYSSLLVQATSETKDSAIAFEKSLSIMNKISTENRNTPGIGLIMGMKKNVRDLPYIKQNGILRKFNGGQLDIDSPRFINFFTNIAKGLLVISTEKIYNWQNFKFNVIFDHTDFAQIQNTMQPAFEYIVKNRQFAEKWEDVLFLAGINTLSPEGKTGSLFAISIFSSHLAIISIKEK